MKAIGFLIISLAIISCSDTKENNELCQEEKIKLQYISWGCDCANWATIDDIKKYENLDSLAAACIFIEPINDSLKLSDTLGFNGDIIEFSGKFYKDKKFPKGFRNTEQAEKARVFQYSNFKINKSNYRETLRNISK